MSHEKLQGLTLEMTLDAIGVQEGMKGLKRQLGVVNSEMKANLSAFDKSEKSMQKYQTRLDGLNNKLTIQKKMYGQAKQELKYLNDSYRNAGTEIKKVETQLSKLTAEHKRNDQALKKSNDALKISNAELKKSETQYRRTNNQRDKAWEKLKELRKAEQDLKNSGEATSAQLKRASAATQKQSQKHKELVQRYKEEEQQVKKLRDKNSNLAKTNEKVTHSYEKTKKELKENESRHKKLNKEIQDYAKNQAEATKKINSEKASLNNLERAIEKTSKEMKLFNREQALANSHFTKTADKLSDSYSRFGMGLQSVGRNMSMYVTTPIVGALGYTSKLGVEFDDSMRKVQATSGASGKQLDQLKAKAREMGATTKFSATDSADALNYMALAGWKTNDMVKGLPGIMSLAAASGEDLAQVSDIVTDGLTAFGLKAKDSGRFADVLAAASANANTNVLGMGDAFKYAAPVAGALGYTIEDTSIAIGLMSNAGIKGEKAGTALRTMFTNLAKPTKAMKNQMEELGISITDSNGEMLPMREVLDQLRDKFSGLSKDQQASAAATIFGKEAMSGALAVINASESDYTKLSKAIDKSEGSANKMSKTMEGGLGGSLRELRSAAEELGLSIFESVQPALKGMVGGLKSTVDYLNGLPKGAKLAAVGFGLITAATGPALLATGLLIRGIGSAMKGYAGLNRIMAKNSIEAGVNATAHSAAGTAMMTTNSKGAKASKGIGNLTNVFGLGTKSIKSFGGMLLKGVKSFGPWGLALTAVTTGLGIAYKKVDWFRKGVNGAGEVIKTFSSGIGGSLLTSIKDLGNWVGDLGTKFMDTWEKSKQGKDATKDYEKLKSATKSVFDELSKGSKKATDTVNVLGKGVSKGTKKALGEYVKLSEGTIKEFEKVKINGGKINKETQNDLSTSIYQTGKEASKVVKERGQEIQNNLKEALSYSDSLSEEDKQNIIIRSKKAGKVKLEEVNALNAEINKLTIEAYQDGKISPEEQKLIQKKEEARNKLVIGYATKGEAERQAILSRMKYNAEGLSNKEISKTLKEAYEIEEDEIKKAADKRDKALQAANASLKDKSINKNEHRSIVLDIESEYNDAVDKAKKKSGEVRDTVKKGNKDISKEMDLSNGHVYTGAEKLWKNFVSDFKKYWGSGTAINDTLNGWHDGYVKKASKIGYDIIDWIGRGLSSSFEKNKEALSNVGLMIWNPIKSGWNSTTEWVSKKTGSATGWLTGVKVKAGNLWQEVKTTTSTTFKTLTKQTKTKFGNMYKSSAGWLGKTAGTALGKFTNISSSATKWLGKASGTAVGKFKSISKGARDWLSKTAGTASGKFISVSGSATKWLGKTHTTAKDKFFGVWKQGKEKFTWTANKVGEKTKTAYNASSKWLGKTYRNAKSNFGSMWDSAKTKFTDIASHGWSKAKSTYKGFKSWLDKTLSYIRNIGSDMARAAEDLGIKVANKAITGLNNMINGINKISTGITGESLIKPIDTIQSAGSIGKKLSTGTTSPSVSTDSEGGLKQATMAIVNDKGPGNGTGGFTQEIIERKDGSMYMPKGKDVPVFLNQGDKVHSGGVTQQLDKLGLLPRFHSGSNGKKRLDERLIGALGSASGKFGVKVSEAKHGITKKAENAMETVEKNIKSGVSNLGKGIGEVMEWAEKPKELVNAVMKKMGVNFDNIPAFTGTLVRGAYKKLSSGLVNKVKEMFEDFGGGGGDASWLPWDNVWQRFGSYTGGLSFNGGKHYGMDFGMTPGTPVYAVKGGKARVFDDYGGGHSVEIKTGANEWNWYMHLSKQIARTGQMVQAGQKIALSGNSGNYTAGSGHLHFQLMRGSHAGNDTAINPEKWLRSLKNGVTGGNGASYARKIIKQAQNILGGRYKSSAITEYMMKLAKRESNFNTNAVNNWDSNAQRGTPSKGMFQMIEPTFRANAKPGYTKFGNTLHEAISSLRYIVRTYGWGGFPRAAAAAYANGGISSTHKIAEISENNKAEAIVPLTKRTRAIQLTEQIMDYLGMDVMKPKVTVNNDTSVMEKLLKQIVALNDKSNRQTDTIIQLIKQIPQGTYLSKLEPILSTLQGSRLNNANYTMGGAR